MDSLVLELQRDAIDGSISLLDLLRKALVVARKLNIKEFQHWIQNELDGYPDKSEPPKYRFIMGGKLKAHNPFHGWIPISIPIEIDKFISEIPIHQPISQIEALIKNPKNKNLVVMPPALDNLLRSYFDIRYEIAIHIDPSQVYGVLEAVRNVVLNWSLKLEEDGILGEGMTFSQKEKQIASTHNYNNDIKISLEQLQMQSSSSESQSNSESFNNDLREANIANFANQVQDNASQIASNFSQHISQNFDDITKLISNLREVAQNFPETQREQTMVHLDDLQEDIVTPEKQKPQRIKARLSALLAIASIVAGGADFANNVSELSAKLGVALEADIPQLIQHLPASKPIQPN